MTAKKNPVEMVKNTMLTISASAAVLSGVVALVWQAYAAPEIDRKICAKVDPVIEAIEYQNFLMMATMSDEQLEAANRRWKGYKDAMRQGR